MAGIGFGLGQSGVPLGMGGATLSEEERRLLLAAALAGNQQPVGGARVGALTAAGYRDPLPDPAFAGAASQLTGLNAAALANAAAGGGFGGGGVPSAPAGPAIPPPVFSPTDVAPMNNAAFTLPDVAGRMGDTRARDGGAGTSGYVSGAGGIGGLGLANDPADGYGGGYKGRYEGGSAAMRPTLARADPAARRGPQALSFQPLPTSTADRPVGRFKLRFPSQKGGFVIQRVKMKGKEWDFKGAERPINWDYFEAFRVRPGADVSAVDNWKTKGARGTFGKIVTWAVASFYEGLTEKHLVNAGMAKNVVIPAGNAYAKETKTGIPRFPPEIRPVGKLRRQTEYDWDVRP